ncbi:MAG: M1 family metallopeptidase [Clostridiales bacterium]|nr:M1 family metallopeptidase [Clostridiales bacterium]
MKKRLWIIILVTAAIAAALLLWRWLSLPVPDKLSPEDVHSLAGPCDSIVVEASFIPESNSMHVRQTLFLTSRTPESRDTVVLRTWPNAFQKLDTSPLASEAEYSAFYPEGFSMGALVMQNASLEKEGMAASEILYRYADDAKTVLTLPLPGSWQEGETLAITLEYTLILPKAASRYGVWDDIYSFGNAFPLPAIWEEGSWRTDEYTLVGDPFYSELFHFDVTLTSPDGYACAAPVLPSVENRQDGNTVRHYRLAAARDFALCLSREYRLTTIKRGSITVQAFTKEPAQGRRAAEYALKALDTYSSLYGPYPYDCFTLAQIAFPHSGMEYPAMALLSGDVLAAENDTLEAVIAHETAHQWWYSLVGSDPVNHPWQDEALCEFSRLTYWEKHHGKAAAEDIFQREILPSLRVSYTATAGSPLSWFSDMDEYYILVYNRGAAMLCALDHIMGGDLNGFLRFYRERYAFRIAGRADFLSALREYSGQDYEPLIIDYLDTLITP